MHPSLLTGIAKTGIHIDLSEHSIHPSILVDLLRQVVAANGHLTVKGGHPSIYQDLARIGGKHLTIKF
ncbi:hypothetical protein SSARUM2_002159 [Serratia sp. K-E0102]|uniref:hypothetical protein n=1 Tax=Serratia TaxID=613 RepID=UPI0012B5F6CE|nr:MULTISPECIES: hypothetical protein [Serratia]WGZ69741.1 hypothetical protein SSARUM2_002159 [Serratia sp. K-E0102]